MFHPAVVLSVGRITRNVVDKFDKIFLEACDV